MVATLKKGSPSRASLSTITKVVLPLRRFPRSTQNLHKLVDGQNAANGVDCVRLNSAEVVPVCNTPAPGLWDFLELGILDVTGAGDRDR
jgi:hypothetical protein